MVLEGVDGAGTTTHSARLAAWLRRRKIPCVLTREPTDQGAGACLREILTGHLELAGPGWRKGAALAGLFTADRIQHMRDVIVPALASGKTVISDRYSLSTMAYQSAAGVPMDLLMRIYVEQSRDTDAFRSWVADHISRHHNNAIAMTRLANTLCNIEDVTVRLPDLTLKAAKAAYEASGQRDLEALAVYARTLYQIGSLERAIAVQHDAVALATGPERDLAQGGDVAQVLTAIGGNDHGVPDLELRLLLPRVALAAIALEPHLDDGLHVMPQ